MTRKERYFLVLLSVFSMQLSAATIVIQNDDGVDEGFNDPTPAASIPAQKGNNPGTTLGELRLNVFNEAAKVWEGVLNSNVTITVGATFDALSCTMNSGTLGFAGATASGADFPGADPGVAYVVSVAESLAGSNLNGSSVEITAQFNSDVDDREDCLGGEGFYYGLNSIVPEGMAALFPVVLHEIAHGLGFLSLVDAGPDESGAFVGAGGFPDSFSRNLVDLDTGKSWDQMNNTERKASALNEPELVWSGAQVTANRSNHLGPAPEFEINAPGSIAGIFETVLGEEPTIVIPAGGVTAGVLDGQTFMDLDDDLADGCSQIAFGGTFTGKIVLFDKSDNCGAAFPAFYSQHEGALAVIIAATEANGLPDVGGQISNQEITIPYFGVSKSVGAALRANLGSASVTFRNSLTSLLGDNQGKVKMYAPQDYDGGSSVSHWSTTASPNLLMEPSLNADLVFKNVDLTTAAFRDIGWPAGSGEPDVPAKPTGLKASDGTFSDRVRVTFNMVAGATVYRVFRCLDAGQTCGSPIGFPKTGSFDDTKGIVGRVYYYRVRACTPKVCGKFSSANTGFSSTGSAAPAKPTAVRATDGSFSDKVRVTFNTVAGATVYRVFRCLTAGQTCGSPIGFPKTGSFDDTKGVPGTVYYYRVRACTPAICGKFSSANTGFSSSAPAKPTGIKATDGTFVDKVRVTFNTVAGATVYRVFRCLDTGQTCGSPIGFPKSGLFDDKKGTSGTVFYYRVRACIGTTCGKFSSANAGHRGNIGMIQADVSNETAAVPIPVLTGPFGRWLLILMTMGFGLLLLKRRAVG